MGTREVPLYFLSGCMAFVALFVLCLMFAVVCPYTRIRAFCLRCCGYKESETEHYAKLQQQRGDMSWTNTRRNIYARRMNQNVRVSILHRLYTRKTSLSIQSKVNRSGRWMFGGLEKRKHLIFTYVLDSFKLKQHMKTSIFNSVIRRPWNQVFLCSTRCYCRNYFN